MVGCLGGCDREIAVPPDRNLRCELFPSSKRLNRLKMALRGYLQPEVGLMWLCRWLPERARWSFAVRTRPSKEARKSNRGYTCSFLLHCSGFQPTISALAIVRIGPPARASVMAITNIPLVCAGHHKKALF